MDQASIGRDVTGGGMWAVFCGKILLHGEKLLFTVSACRRVIAVAAGAM
jgi:hypothetical protein